MIKNFRILIQQDLVKDYPKWLPDNVVYETIMGSVAYGVSSDTSDCDIYSLCIPPKNYIFPYTNTGFIFGFGKTPPIFDQYIKHGIKSLDDLGGKGRVYDVTIFGIVKAFDLWMDGNPNCLEMLFTSNECIITQTQISKLIRDNAELFLTKQCYPRFIGYLSSQIHKAKIKNPEGKRKELVEKFGYDTKFIANAVRLAYECETILTERTMDLRRFKDHIKSIRNGDCKLDDILLWLDEKEKALISMKEKSTIPEKPDANKIKSLMISCIESHYGSIDGLYSKETLHEQALKEISAVMSKYNIY
jgi:predicted nucleotidyltransferase